MRDDSLLSLHVFGPGRGESVVLEVRRASGDTSVFIVDASAAKPEDSPAKNPIIAFQDGRFSWDEVEGVCLSHAHEDHFTGLAPVARKTTNAKWLRPTLTPFDAFVRHYEVVAKTKGFSRSKARSRRWIAGSIRALADWGERADDFVCLSDRCCETDDAFKMTFVAPEDNIATDYGRKLHANVDAALMNEPDRSPRNLHNVASSGLVVDAAAGGRALLLGDMVEESWARLLGDGPVRALLEERKADVVKLPHHCSSGAVFGELLELTCDASKTVAVFTPFSYRTAPPHKDALDQVAGHVRELWATVGPPEDDETWRCGGSHGVLFGRLLESYLKEPRSRTKTPVECRVTVSVQASGEVSVSHGANARCFR